MIHIRIPRDWKAVDDELRKITTFTALDAAIADAQKKLDAVKKQPEVVTKRADKLATEPAAPAADARACAAQAHQTAGKLGKLRDRLRARKERFERLKSRMGWRTFRLRLRLAARAAYRIGVLGPPRVALAFGRWLVASLASVLFFWLRRDEDENEEEADDDGDENEDEREGSWRPYP